MHYAVLAILPDDNSVGTIEDRVQTLLSQYQDEKWDWWQIGGRFTGRLDGYNPETDPANIHTCDLCGGTGKRTDLKVKNGCNGCQGTGKQVAWPTQWKRHLGDVMPVPQLTQEHLNKFYAVVTIHDWHSTEKYVPFAKNICDHFQKCDLPSLEWIKQQGTLAVVVDCHN